MRKLDIVEVDEDVLQHLAAHLCEGIDDGAGYGAACEVALTWLGRAVGDPSFVNDYINKREAEGWL